MVVSYMFNTIVIFILYLSGMALVFSFVSLFGGDSKEATALSLLWPVFPIILLLVLFHAKFVEKSI